MNPPNNDQMLELLEERAQVHKERVNTGKVVLSKQVKTRTVDIPITLTEEHLVITYQQDDPLPNLDEMTADDLVSIIDHTKGEHVQITINGQVHTLTPQTPIEIVLSCETATVTKTAHAIEEIRLDTQTISREQIFSVELQKEVLDVQEGEDLLKQSINTADQANR
ncbi:YsnF/AvaK domain-containing protein [Moraxella canis]|uniref:YsnF/AvaK domain-containing protein n=1 Tax=Moraxella canis TaxID=90239 RepID=UPI000AD8F546|nr:YsnF/AvaK domain-containing protein [Moraxella canis]